MTDKQKAVETITDFLCEESKRILLVKGYDNEAKLRAVLSCLNSNFDKGIIRTSSMSNIADHINHAFNKKLLPNSVTSTATYKIGQMKVKFSSYATHTSSNPRGNKETFTLFYPVQLVLDSASRYEKFVSELADIQSRKIILITTNEWGIKEWNIEELVDEIFFYSVENDNPQIMKNLRNNDAI
ncbi:hypothetical protein ABEW00_03155 [Rossellomorea vietnamensis]|uniref:hypothetical protein n=1 Tax=Rossellomorea vietnamensis TaxID=218284 RepID=UPI003D2963CB